MKPQLCCVTLFVVSSETLFCILTPLALKMKTPEFQSFTRDFYDIASTENGNIHFVVNGVGPDLFGHHSQEVTADVSPGLLCDQNRIPYPAEYQIPPKRKRCEQFGIDVCSE